MPIRKPRYSHEAANQLGYALYESGIRAQVEADHEGKVVVIDIETGAFEIDGEEMDAFEALRILNPDAELCSIWIGYRDASIVKIDFEHEEQSFLWWVFMEVFGGGSTEKIQNILGKPVEDVRHLEAKVQSQYKAGSSSISLTAAEWRIMYEAVNAVIYGLGPSELSTCTGRNLQEVCSINLKICATLWRASGVGRSWVGSS
jgi:hypothetical protein